MKALPPLTIEQILKWADAHQRKTGVWPNKSSGEVMSEPGEKWANVQAALNQGLRGLSGKSSLAKLLAEHRGARNIMALPDLTIQQILKWADAHKQRTGAWPNSKSGKVLGASGETWGCIQQALTKGRRRLRGESSLAKLLAENRGTRNIMALPDLTIQQILKWADIHHDRTGVWPSKSSGEVMGEPGEKWRNIENGLRLGLRRLFGGSSLAKLLAEKRGVRNMKSLSPLSIEQILKWADAHQRKTGVWPNRSSGEVMGEPGEKWGNIENGLRRGLRSLPGGSSLAKLIESERKRRTQ